MSRAAPAASGLVLCALLAAAAAAGTAATAAALVLVVAVLTAGWPALLSLPSPRGTAAVVGLSGAVAVAAVLLTPAGSGSPPLRALPVVLAVAVLGAFTHQLLRRDGRPRVVDGLSGAVTGLVVAALASGWLAALAASGWPLVATGAAAVAGGSMSAVLACPVRLRALVGLGAATAAGALAAWPEASVSAGTGALLGVSVGVVLAVAHGVLLPLTASGRSLAAWSLGAAPVAASGVLVYAVGRALLR